MHIRAFAIATLVAVVAACSDDNSPLPTAPSPFQVALASQRDAKLIVSPQVDTVEVGETITLTVSPNEAPAGDSSTSTGTSRTLWGLDDPTLASVSAGEVVGRKEGTARVVALRGRDYGFATVVVRPASSDTAASPLPTGAAGSLYAGYSAASPHWSHIRTLITDFYYHWNTQERAWAGAHFDGALSGSGSAWRAANPGVTHLPYTLLWTVLTPATGASSNLTSVYYDDMRSWYASHTGYRLEDAFLHVAGAERSASNRLKVKIWDSERWLINPADPGARAYTVDRYRRVVEGEEGVFVDEASSGDILPRVKGGGELTASQYQAAYTSLLSAIKSAFGRRMLMLNTAEYMKEFDRANAMAAGAVHLELFNNAMLSQMTLRWQWMEDLLAQGVSVDLVGPVPAKWADDHASTYPRGNYATSGDRLRMWELASYYMVVGKSPEGFFFHIKTPGWETPFEKLWFKAQEANIGHPLGERSEHASGTDPVGQSYTVFAREFERALVLIRPQTGWESQSYLDATAVKVALPSGESWLPLRADGTLGAAVTSVKLRNSESLILIKKSRL